jgi:hypothetical protein
MTLEHGDICRVERDNCTPDEVFVRLAARVAGGADFPLPAAQDRLT